MPKIPSKLPETPVKVNGPHYLIGCGSCLDFMKLSYDNGNRYDLIFADPPFNIDQSYNGFKDKLDWRSYHDWTMDWIELAHNLLSRKGILCLHGNDHLAKLYLEAETEYNMKRIAWINWHYRFGQCGRGNWIDARCHCLIYAHDPNFYTWNPDDVLVPSDRAVKYNDRRIHEHERGGLRLPGTVWGVPSDGEYWGRIQGNNEERRHDHPNQLPEVYLERLIRAYTAPGDVILDPFGGSGTTITVAKALGRSCITVDISESNCDSIEERLEKGAVRVRS